MTDTSPEARDVQLRVLRAMSGEQRLLLAVEMSEFARAWLGRGSGATIRTGRKSKLLERTVEICVLSATLASPPAMGIQEALERIITALEQSDIAYIK